MSRLLPSLSLLALATLSAFAPSPVPGQVAPARGKKYALLVGVKAYDSDKIADLRFCERDVEALAKLLTGRGGGFHEVRVMTVSRGKARPEDRPTVANVRTALKKMLDRATRDDTVLFAVSAHGAQMKIRQADGSDKDLSFILPCDARPRAPSSMLALSEFFTRLAECSAREKLVLIDACRSEGAVKLEVDVLPPHIPNGTAALLSCAAGEVSYETDKLGGGHGLFFHFVLEGLRGKAKNEDGEVTWNDLVTYVTRAVPRAAPKVVGATARQSPHHAANLVGSPLLRKISLVAGAPVDLPKEAVNSVGMKLVRIPAGKFKMGSPEEEQARDSDEGPARQVEISQPFLMGAYEVTQEQYQKVMGANPSYYSKNGGAQSVVKGLDTRRFPVEDVSWQDAKNFCEKLTDLPEEKKAGRAYRLPTEAEWEHAARAGTSTPFHFGKTLSGAQANFKGEEPYGLEGKTPFVTRPTTVGSYAANAWGLFDMHGNVAEWCEDWYAASYYREGPASDPVGPEVGTQRVARGGSWFAAGARCRSAFRASWPPNRGSNLIGFRVVCVPSDRAH